MNLICIYDKYLKESNGHPKARLIMLFFKNCIDLVSLSVSMQTCHLKSIKRTRLFDVATAEYRSFLLETWEEIEYFICNNLSELKSLVLQQEVFILF